MEIKVAHGLRIAVGFRPRKFSGYSCSPSTNVCGETYQEPAHRHRVPEVVVVVASMNWMRCGRGAAGHQRGI